MDDKEYRQFVDARVAELEAGQEKIAELLLFKPRHDLSRETIIFLDGEDVIVEAEVAPVGSRGRRWGSWMWAWANQSLPPELRTLAEPLRQLGTTTGREEFLKEDAYPVTGPEAWELTAVACGELGALGVYVLPIGEMDFFFAVRKLTHLRPPEFLQEKAQRAAADALLQEQGVRLLNLLRRRFPDLRLKLAGADLRGAPEPWAGDLHAQILFDYDFMQQRKPRDLSGADLSRSRFDEAIMRGVTLSGASFENSSLVDADLSGADVRGTSFRGAFLNGVNFTRAKLEGADFAGAELARTLLTDVDLSEVKGLDEVHHMAASEISFSTLVASQFKLTPTFLHRAGVSRGLIQDLARGKRLSKKYQTCFLSYSSKDGEFAARLYESLRRAGVRVFWDHFDVVPGEYLEDQIAEAIREHDRLLVVLSEHSMASAWVKREIELAWYRKRESLLPVRLCPIEDVRRWTEQHEGLPDLAELFPVLDFSGWEAGEKYEHSLSLLLKSFAGGVEFSADEEAPPPEA